MLVYTRTNTGFSCSLPLSVFDLAVALASPSSEGFLRYTPNSRSSLCAHSTGGSHSRMLELVPSNRSESSYSSIFISLAYSHSQCSYLWFMAWFMACYVVCPGKTATWKELDGCIGPLCMYVMCLPKESLNPMNPNNSDVILYVRHNCYKIPDNIPSPM